MTKDNSGPAYPINNDTVAGVVFDRGQSPEGATLRDYFVAAALMGLLAGRPDADCGPEGFANDALLYADAMIAEREK